MFDFLFNPNGRVSRKGYGIGFLLPYLLLSGLPGLLLVPQNGIGIVLGVIGLFFFWPSIAVSIKRFHDFGRSGWLYVAVLVVLIALQLYASMPFIAASFSDPSLASEFEGLTGFGTMATMYDFLSDRPDRLIAYILGTAGGYALMLAFLIIPGQREANRFGEDPLTSGRGFAD